MTKAPCRSQRPRLAVVTAWRHRYRRNIGVLVYFNYFKVIVPSLGEPCASPDVVLAWTQDVLQI